jgi:hypothetical protein
MKFALYRVKEEQIMPWRNAITDGLPHNNEEVLITVDGVVYQAIFHNKEKKFEDLKSGKFFSVLTQKIYWQRIDDLKTSA